MSTENEDVFSELTKDLFTEDEKAEMPDLPPTPVTSQLEQQVSEMFERMKGTMTEALAKVAEIEKDAIEAAAEKIKDDGFDSFAQDTFNCIINAAMENDEFMEHPLTRAAMTKGFLRAAYEAGRREVSA